MNRELRVTLKKCENGTLQVKIQAVETPTTLEKHVEFTYWLLLAHRFSLRMNTIEIYGKAIIDEESNPAYICYHKLPIYHRLRGVSFKNMHMRFAVKIDTFYDRSGIRNLLLTEDMSGPIHIVSYEGRRVILHVEVIVHLKLRAPLLLEDIKSGKLSEENCLVVFIQLLFGVQVQLEEEQIKPLLEMATKYKVWNAKKYCEHQLIWRDDFEFSKKQKFKMICKYNLNILMNQLLMDVKSVEKLAKLASIAIGIEPMNTNIFKLLVAKMYEMS